MQNRDLWHQGLWWSKLGWCGDQAWSVKDLKYKDLRAVCSQLKIKGVKNTLKESMLEKIVSVYKLKERYGKQGWYGAGSHTNKKGAPVPL